MDISNLEKNEKKIILKKLRLYQDLTKKLWNRWKRVFNKINNWKSYYLVEYFPNNDLDFVYNKSKEVYKNFFWLSPSREEIVFVEKKSMWGWMKVFMDDDLVDLSFEKIEKKLKK